MKRNRIKAYLIELAVLTAAVIAWGIIRVAGIFRRKERDRHEKTIAEEYSA